MQTLNVLQNDMNTALNAAGTATFLVFTGVAIIRGGGLPRWLGWVGVVFGALSATGFTGPAGVGLWILIASLTLIVTDRNGDRAQIAGSQS